MQILSRLPFDVGLDSVLLGMQNYGLAEVPESANMAGKLLADITVQKMFKALLSILASYAMYLAIQASMNWLSEQAPLRYRLLIKQSVPFWKALVLVITLAYLLNLFVNLSENNLLALSGTLAVALGFAFKDYVSSIIAGIVTLFEASYRMGDRIRIGDHYGEVIGYGLRGLRLRTPNGSTVTIPHNKTWTEPIVNANNGQLEAQVVTDFYVDHQADLDTIIRILYQTAYSSHYTQLKKPIVVTMEEHPETTQFQLKSYPMDARDEFVYKTDLLRRAKQALSRLNLTKSSLNLD